LDAGGSMQQHYARDGSSPRELVEPAAPKGGQTAAASATNNRDRVL
jgi:hypothetical protein